MAPMFWEFAHYIKDNAKHPNLLFAYRDAEPIQRAFNILRENGQINSDAKQTKFYSNRHTAVSPLMPLYAMQNAEDNCTLIDVGYSGTVYHNLTNIVNYADIQGLYMMGVQSPKNDSNFNVWFSENDPSRSQEHFWLCERVLEDAIPKSHTIVNYLSKNNKVIEPILFESKQDNVNSPSYKDFYGEFDKTLTQIKGVETVKLRECLLNNINVLGSNIDQYRVKELRKEVECYIL